MQFFSVLAARKLIGTNSNCQKLHRPIPLTKQLSIYFFAVHDLLVDTKKKMYVSHCGAAPSCIKRRSGNVKNGPRKLLFFELSPGVQLNSTTHQIQPNIML